MKTSEIWNFAVSLKGVNCICLLSYFPFGGQDLAFYDTSRWGCGVMISVCHVPEPLIDLAILYRFLPNFARLGSWNVAMFVTVEQVHPPPPAPQPLHQPLPHSAYRRLLTHELR